MSPRRTRIVAALVIGGILLVLGVWRCTPLWPGPGLPAGATRLTLTTEAPHLVPAMGCAAALLGPVRVTTSGDKLIVVSVETGETVKVIWPAGWAAWRVDGRAELVRRDGSIVARDGDVLEDRFGGGMSDDDAFHVCDIGS